MSPRLAAGLLAAFVIPGPLPGGAAAEPASPPVVLELFTSQSCSSCPPADALLAELARGGDDRLLPLAFHVTYWDRLGWKDPFSLPEATERQRRYAALWGRDNVFTPQMVVQGARDAVGSDRRAVMAAIEAARAAAAEGPAMRLAPGEGGAGLALSVGAGRGSGTLWLVGFDPRHVTEVRAGENGGRNLVHTQVVRSLRQAGAWRGEALRLILPAPAGGERAAVLLQAPDGRILSAAALPAAR